MPCSGQDRCAVSLLQRGISMAPSALATSATRSSLPLTLRRHDCNFKLAGLQPPCGRAINDPWHNAATICDPGMCKTAIDVAGGACLNPDTNATVNGLDVAVYLANLTSPCSICSKAMMAVKLAGCDHDGSACSSSCRPLICASIYACRAPGASAPGLTFKTLDMAVSALRNSTASCPCIDDCTFSIAVLQSRCGGALKELTHNLTMVCDDGACKEAVAKTIKVCLRSGSNLTLNGMNSSAQLLSLESGCDPCSRAATAVRLAGCDNSSACNSTCRPLLCVFVDACRAPGATPPGTGRIAVNASISEVRNLTASCPCNDDCGSSFAAVQSACGPALNETHGNIDKICNTGSCKIALAGATYTCLSGKAAKSKIATDVVSKVLLLTSMCSPCSSAILTVGLAGCDNDRSACNSTCRPLVCASISACTSPGVMALGFTSQGLAVAMAKARSSTATCRCTNCSSTIAAVHSSCGSALTDTASNLQDAVCNAGICNTAIAEARDACLNTTNIVTAVDIVVQLASFTSFCTPCSRAMLSASLAGCNDSSACTSNCNPLVCASIHACAAPGAIALGTTNETLAEAMSKARSAISDCPCDLVATRSAVAIGSRALDQLPYLGSSGAALPLAAAAFAAANAQAAARKAASVMEQKDDVKTR